MSQRTRLAQLRNRIEQLTQQLDAIPAGIKQTSVDGTATIFDREAINAELDLLNRRAAVLAGRRERIASIRLDNSF